MLDLLISNIIVYAKTIARQNRYGDDILYVLKVTNRVKKEHYLM